MADKQLILKTMSTLLTAYPGQSRSDDDLKLLRDVWLDVLSDVPDEALKAAATEYLRSAETFAPAPGVLRARATQLIGADSESLAEQAWQAVIDYNHGHGDPLEDELAKTIMRRLGWAAWDNVQVDDVHWWHDKFVKAYGDAHEKQVVIAALSGEAAKMIGGR